MGLQVNYKIVIGTIFNAAARDGYRRARENKFRNTKRERVQQSAEEKDETRNISIRPHD